LRPTTPAAGPPSGAVPQLTRARAWSSSARCPVRRSMAPPGPCAASPPVPTLRPGEPAATAARRPIAPLPRRPLGSGPGSGLSSRICRVVLHGAANVACCPCCRLRSAANCTVLPYSLLFFSLAFLLPLRSDTIALAGVRFPCTRCGGHRQSTSITDWARTAASRNNARTRTATQPPPAGRAPASTEHDPPPAGLWI
jgi:hypothetical protein